MMYNYRIIPFISLLINSKISSKIKYTISFFISLSLILLFNNNLLANCSINAWPLSFGNYKPFNNSDLQAYSNIVIRCRIFTSQNLNNLNINNSSNSFFVRIKLSTGNSGNYANRELRSGTNILYYNLYTNSNRTRIWGDGTGGSKVVHTIVTSNRKTIHVFGNIPNSQSVPPGIYTDNIIAEISF